MGSSALAPDWSLQDPVAYRALYYAISVAVETHDWKALRWATDKLDEIEREGRAAQGLLEVVASAADKVESAPPPASTSAPLPAPEQLKAGSTALEATAKGDESRANPSLSADAPQAAVAAASLLPISLTRPEESHGQVQKESFLDLMND